MKTKNSHSKKQFKIAFITLFSILILSVVLLAGFASADIQVNTYSASKDFTLASSYDSVSICSCSTKYDTITVTNTGTWPAIFTVSMNQITDKITLSENNFELQPGQSKDVFMYITADCSKGSDTLKITVTSNLGVQKVISKDIARDRCQNIAVYMTNYTQSLNPCQSKSLELFIQNVGPFKEDYTLDSNYDGYITYNANKFTLEPNQVAKVTATVKFDCSIYGMQNLVFNAHSVNNRLTASVAAPLNIARNYTFDVSVGNNINDANVGLDVCNRVLSTQLPITITNHGSVANNYTIDFNDLPKFAKISGIYGNKISLNPKESKTFIIDIDSTAYRYEHKTFDSSMTITSQLGDISQTKNIALNLLPCYEPVVSIDKTMTTEGNRINSQKNPLETCSGYMYTYDVNVANNGRYKENMTLSLDENPTSVSLSKNYLSIDPAKSASVKLIIIGPEYNTYYNIKVNAQLSNGITASDNFWIKSYDQASCHAAVVDDTSYDVNYQTSIVNIKITNKGITDSKYAVSWNGSKILGFKDTRIELNRTQSSIISLNVNSSNLNESIYAGRLVIKNTDSSAVYSDDINVKLRDKNIFQKTFEYFAFGTVCRQFSMYELVAILLVIILIIIFLIVGPKYPYKFKNRFKAKVPVLILLTVVFLIGLILVITFAGFPKTQSQVYNLTTNASELRYEWLEDNSYSLNAKPLFFDPENRTLTYAVSGIHNIKAVTNNNVITFYPDMGWSGTEYAKITATDPMGGSVTSPNLTLVVRNVPRKSLTELYTIYCWYINLAILVIILALLFVASFVRQKKRVRK